MAEIVMGIAMANSPVVVIDSSHWPLYAENDKVNKDLYDNDGNHVTYGQLVERNGERFAHLATPERYKQQHAQITGALDRLNREIAEVKPDAMVVISYVSRDLFGVDNQPLVFIYHGEKMVSRGHKIAPNAPEWVRMQEKAWGQDGHHEFPVASDLAGSLIERLTNHGVDVACGASLPDPDKAGFPHMMTFPLMRFAGGGKIPAIPLALNAILAPNLPPAARCYAIGEAIGRAISEIPGTARIAVLLSAAMCHSVVNRPVDDQVLAGLREHRADLLSSVPNHQLHGHNGQCRMYIMLGGIMGARPIRWDEYVSIYRTPAGTGVGLYFARW